MKIRDNPLLVQWPPTWIGAFGDELLLKDKSEDLVLKEVKLLPHPHHDYRYYIVIFGEYVTKTNNIFNKMKTGKTFTSTIIFMEDLEFLNRFYQELKSSVGKTIREIGDSEIQP
jgi:hypothetical protein